MKGLFHFITDLFGSRAELTVPQDNTIYRVETSVGKYCGRIIYQDEVVIRLRCTKSKPVKVLKANIQKISIVKNETVDQYHQWLGTKVMNFS